MVRYGGHTVSQFPAFPWRRGLFGPGSGRRRGLVMSPKKSDAPVEAGPNAEAVAYGEHLRMLRVRAHLTQSDVAKMLKKLGYPRVSQTTVSSWENADYFPAGNRLWMLEDIYTTEEHGVPDVRITRGAEIYR